MKVLIEIQEELFDWLRTEAKRRNLEDIESVIQELQRDEERRRRHEVGKRIDKLREEIYAKYGEMPDSVELIREDRQR